MPTDRPYACSPFPPFHPDGTTVHFPAEWLTDTVCALAHGICADLAFDRLPILADALEEAGCDEPLVLHHCRYCTHHLPECWVVERVVRSDVLWTGDRRERHSSAVAEATRQGHPDDPDVIPGRPMNVPASEDPAEAERRQERRDR